MRVPSLIGWACSVSVLNSAQLQSPGSGAEAARRLLRNYYIPNLNSTPMRAKHASTIDMPISAFASVESPTAGRDVHVEVGVAEHAPCVDELPDVLGSKASTVGLAKNVAVKMATVLVT
jgi:hypothetical protein